MLNSRAGRMHKILDASQPLPPVLAPSPPTAPPSAATMPVHAPAPAMAIHTPAFAEQRHGNSILTYPSRKLHSY